MNVTPESCMNSGIMKLHIADYYTTRKIEINSSFDIFPGSILIGLRGDSFKK